MPYAILRFQKRKAGSVASCERHNERKKEAYEYDFNYYEIAAMEHCTASSVGKSISIAKEKIREQMKKYLCP